jgi:hypothetical protein
MAKTKRLTGEVYWKLHDLLEEGEKKVKEYGEWARKKCRELKLLPDVTDFVQGVVWNEPLRQGDAEQHRTQVANIEDEAAITRALELQRDVDEINQRIDKLVRRIAMAAKVRPEQVNVKAGTINMEPEDPDTEDIELELPPDE